MNVSKTEIDGLLIIQPKVFEDHRGCFLETYNRRRYAKFGLDMDFPQDNMSYSRQGTLQGRHYQFPQEQAKLVQVLNGEVFDVAVDIRWGSPTFGRWVGEILAEQNRLQLFIPKGMAHGFCVLSETAVFVYKCSDYYAPECDMGVLWSDPSLGIKWPVEDPLLSAKDMSLPLLKDIPRGRLPVYDE